MKADLELKPARLILEEREASIAEFLELSRQYQEDAWLLAESPARFLFESFKGQLDSLLEAQTTSLIVFGPKAEIRFERPYGGKSGWLRLARPDANGVNCLGRSIGALLRDGSGRKVLFEEYYQPDGSGFLVKFCGRLSGVGAS